MKTKGRLAISIPALALILAMSWRTFSQEGQSIVRSVASVIVTPFVEAQASAALTQSSFKSTRVVAQKPPAPDTEKQTQTEPLPQQRFLRVKLTAAPAAAVETARCGCRKVAPIVVLSASS